MNIIEFKNVWEKYRIKFITGGKTNWEEVWVLEDLNFKVEKGEVLGVVGQNGSGKTTLLKLIAGMLMPDRGEVRVDGKVSALMELGAGFDPEFTGRENIVLNARMYGLQEESLSQQIEKIIAFAGLGKFIDAPIKYYSQGMLVRLAFALAIYVEPDILLIDDILAVGDEEAQQKCIKKVLELKQSGKTIILVSHDKSMMERLSDRVIFLDRGRIIKEGDPQEIVAYYLKTVAGREGELIFKTDSLDLSSCSIEKGDLRVFADPQTKIVKIFCKDREITSGQGLFPAVFLEDGKRWFNSYNAYWEVSRSTEGELKAVFDFAPFPLSMNLTLSIESENTLKIKLGLQIDKPIALIRRHIRLDLQDGYESWQTAEEEGDFLVKQYINEVGPVKLKDGKISEIILKPFAKSNLPEIFVASSLQIRNTIFSIYKQKIDKKEIICLNFSKIIPKKEERLDPGKYVEFEGKIILDKKGIKLSVNTFREEPPTVKSGNLILIFEQGRGKLVYGRNELTTGLGVYSSLRSDGIWYDSYQALWKVKESKNDKIIAIGEWPYIPVSQIWQIERVDKGIISWQVEMDIYGLVNLEIAQANLMLNSGYTSWLIPGVNQGDFLDEYTGQYDILPFRFWYGGVPKGGICVKGKSLPEVIFQYPEEDDSVRAVIENSDSLFQARLLQFQKSDGFNLAKKAVFFRGLIKIESKN